MKDNIHVNLDSAGCVNDCNGNGVCRLFSGEWKCSCHTTYFGENCSLPIESSCDDGVDNDNGINIKFCYRKLVQKKKLEGELIMNYELNSF